MLCAMLRLAGLVSLELCCTTHLTAYLCWQTRGCAQFTSVHMVPHGSLDCRPPLLLSWRFREMTMIRRAVSPTELRVCWPERLSILVFADWSVQYLGGSTAFEAGLLPCPRQKGMK